MSEHEGHGHEAQGILGSHRDEKKSGSCSRWSCFLDPSSTVPYTATVSPAIKRALDIGALCNNASNEKNEDGVFVGQSTDVALLNVLDLFSLSDRRTVSFITLSLSCWL